MGRGKEWNGEEGTRGWGRGQSGPGGQLEVGGSHPRMSPWGWETRAGSTPPQPQRRHTLTAQRDPARGSALRFLPAGGP